MNLVWLRNDLRIDDNPALFNASEKGEVICLYIITEKQWQLHQDAPQKIAFWKNRLKALAKDLEKLSIPIKYLKVDGYAEIPDALVNATKTWGITDLWYNHEYPLNEYRRDQLVNTALEKLGVKCHGYHGDLIQAPGTVLTKAQTMFHVFTPFARQWKKQIDASHYTPLKAPRANKRSKKICSDAIENFWPQTEDFRSDIWPTESKKIYSRFTAFINDRLNNYSSTRDIPSINGTSTLSPYLACGALSARQCFHEAISTKENWQDDTWVNEIIWREFYRHLLFTYPRLSQSKDFKKTKTPITWQDDKNCFSAFCKGETGYPIVDAAIKQLLQTGWMHNRLRMITAGFLTKLLLVDWRKGEEFFMRHLIDGDYASNNGGWQWSASTGADAAPYFRIFNPERQSEKFDPEGVFIKKFIPELSSLDKKSIHNPSEQQRQECNYIPPIIDYKFARQRALDVFAVSMGK